MLRNRDISPGTLGDTGGFSRSNLLRIAFYKKLFSSKAGHCTNNLNPGQEISYVDVAALMSWKMTLNWRHTQDRKLSVMVGGVGEDSPRIWLTNKS